MIQAPPWLGKMRRGRGAVAGIGLCRSMTCKGIARAWSVRAGLGFWFEDDLWSGRMSVAMAATNKWWEMNGSELMVSLSLSSFLGRPHGSRFQSMIIAGRREVFRHGGLDSVFGPEIEVISGPLGDLLEDRGRGLSTVIALFGLIHHYRNTKLRVVGRKKAD